MDIMVAVVEGFLAIVVSFSDTNFSGVRTKLGVVSVAVYVVADALDFLGLEVIVVAVVTADAGVDAVVVNEAVVFGMDFVVL